MVRNRSYSRREKISGSSEGVKRVLKPLKNVFKRVNTWIVIVIISVLTAWGEDLYNTIADWLSPPHVEIAPVHLSIARFTNSGLVKCVVSLAVRNPHQRKLNLEFNEIELFNSRYVHHFNRAEHDWEVEALDRELVELEWSDENLSSLLKLPQDEGIKPLKVYYSITGWHEDTLTETVGEKEVVKCTFWQRPVFSRGEAYGQFELSQIDLEMVRFLTDTETGAKGIDTVAMPSIMVRPVDVVEMSAWKVNYKSGEMLAGVDNRIFRRRYGGMYWGIYDDDTANIQLLLGPREFFSSERGRVMRESFTTFGKYGLDTSDEFIHYSSDPSLFDSAFYNYEKNAPMVVILVYESAEVSRMKNTLEGRGFRVESVQGRLSVLWEKVANTFSSPKKRLELERRFESHIESYNEIVTRNGVFIWWPNAENYPDIGRVEREIEDAAGRAECHLFSCDVRPFSAPLDAPFSSPVFAFVFDSSDQWRETIDSTAIEQK